MSRAIGSRDPRTIHAEYHRQILKRDVVDDAVERPLQEGRVNAHDGADPLLRGHPCCGGDAVGLGDSDVEVPVRERLPEDVGAGAVRHPGRNGHDPLIDFGELLEPSTEDFLVARKSAALLLGLAGDLVEW